MNHINCFIFKTWAFVIRSDMPNSSFIYLIVLTSSKQKQLKEDKKGLLMMKRTKGTKRSRQYRKKIRFMNETKGMIRSREYR